MTHAWSVFEYILPGMHPAELKQFFANCANRQAAPSAAARHKFFETLCRDWRRDKTAPLSDAEIDALRSIKQLDFVQSTHAVLKIIACASDINAALKLNLTMQNFWNECLDVASIAFLRKLYSVQRRSGPLLQFPTPMDTERRNLYFEVLFDCGYVIEIAKHANEMSWCTSLRVFRAVLSIWPRLSMVADPDPTRYRQQYVIIRNNVMSVWKEVVEALGPRLLPVYITKDIADLVIPKYLHSVLTHVQAFPEDKRVRFVQGVRRAYNRIIDERPVMGEPVAIVKKPRKVQSAIATPAPPLPVPSSSVPNGYATATTRGRLTGAICTAASTLGE